MKLEPEPCRATGTADGAIWIMGMIAGIPLLLLGAAVWILLGGGQ